MKSPATSAGPRIEIPAVVDARLNLFAELDRRDDLARPRESDPRNLHELVEIRAPQRHDVSEGLEKSVGEKKRARLFRTPPEDDRDELLERHFRPHRSGRASPCGRSSGGSPLTEMPPVIFHHLPAPVRRPTAAASRANRASTPVSTSSTATDNTVDIPERPAQTRAASEASTRPFRQQGFYGCPETGPQGIFAAILVPVLYSCPFAGEGHVGNPDRSKIRWELARALPATSSWWRRRSPRGPEPTTGSSSPCPPWVPRRTGCQRSPTRSPPIPRAGSSTCSSPSASGSRWHFSPWPSTRSVAGRSRLRGRRAAS